MNKKEFKQQYDIMLQELHRTISCFSNKSNIQEIRDAVTSIAKTYESKAGIPSLIIRGLACQSLADIGGEHFEKDDLETGMEYLQYAKTLFEDAYCDEVTDYLRQAQYHIEKGDIPTGIVYLKKLCIETVDNYEEAIAFRELTPVWERYRYLVENEVPPSLSTCDGYAPCLPENCSKKIEYILAMPKDTLLMELSQHLSEISGCGDNMNWLNKWERIVYDVHELCTRINADGIEDFLYSRGHRFAHTIVALETIASKKGLHLMTMIQETFPKGKVPKSLESIENRLMLMLDKDETIFDEAEAYFHDENVSAELEERMYQFIISNNTRFR